MRDLYHWKCLCGARSYHRPLTLAHAKKEVRRHRARANASDRSAGRPLRPHEAAFIPWEPTYFKPAGPLPQRKTCPVCGKPNVPVTARGTLWRHRATPGLAAYCYGSGPRAPYPPKKTGPRPDLAPDLQAFALDLLVQLIEQDIRREGKLVTSREVHVRLLRERAGQSKSKGRRVAARRPSGD